MDKNMLKQIILEEKELYLGNSAKAMRRRHHKRYEIWKYLYYFRLCQYYSQVRKKSPNYLKKRVAKVMSAYYERKKNIASWKAGVEIGLSSNIGRSLNIWHSGIVVNGNIGEYCTLHGNNIIGNKGWGRENELPTIGNGVDIGVGAVIIGKINIANNCVIGANSIVVRNVDIPSSMVIGQPASIYIKKSEGNTKDND